jgi:hypothetical protein
VTSSARLEAPILRMTPKPVVLDRARREPQLLGDFTVGEAVGDEAGDLLLSPGQPRLRPSSRFVEGNTGSSERISLWLIRARASLFPLRAVLSAPAGVWVMGFVGAAYAASQLLKSEEIPSSGAWKTRHPLSFRASGALRAVLAALPIRGPSDHSIVELERSGPVWLQDVCCPSGVRLDHDEIRVGDRKGARVVIAR